MCINSFRINRMSGDSMPFWLVSKCVMFAREYLDRHLKKALRPTQYWIEINK